MIIIYSLIERSQSFGFLPFRHLFIGLFRLRTKTFLSFRSVSFCIDSTIVCSACRVVPWWGFVVVDCRGEEADTKRNFDCRTELRTVILTPIISKNCRNYPCMETKSWMDSITWYLRKNNFITGISTVRPFIDNMAGKRPARSSQTLQHHTTMNGCFHDNGCWEWLFPR